MSPPSEHRSAGSWISQTDTGSTGSSTEVQELGAGGDTEYASDTPSDDNTEAGTEEGENISEVTCDNTIEEEAETPDRHFLGSELVSHVSDTGHEWREDENENEDKKDKEESPDENEEEDTIGEENDSEEDNEKGTYNETDESLGPFIQMDDVYSVRNENIKIFKEEEIEEKSAGFNHNKDQIMTEVSLTDMDDKGNVILIK